MSNSRKQLENWLKTIDVKGNVIDVGGVAKPVKGRTKTWDVIDYKILDIKKSDFTYDLNEEIPFYFPQFDIAFCLQTLQYVYDPMVAFDNLNSVLKPGGILYLSTPFMFPCHDGGIDCLRYSKKALEALLKNTGFEIIEIKPVTAKDPEMLKTWYNTESKVSHNYSDIGYLVKAVKHK